VSTRQMHLVGHLLTGPSLHHAGAWRHPDSDAHLVLDPSRYENLARIYERGLFDGVFIVDGMNLPGLSEDRVSLEVEYGTLMMMMDPIPVLAQMARVTRHLGLSATMVTSVTPPYQIARQFATLDHLSGGRAGWNIVTGASPAVTDNFGLAALPPASERYDHADEVLEACIALWNTWDRDALEIDRASGRFADPSKVHYVKYEGERVRLKGGLVTPRSPQGRPVFMQAGASERGREFAARWAEIVFTIRNDKAALKEFYDETKGAVEGFGRDPAACAILPSIETFVAESEAQAKEKAAELDELVIERSGLTVLSSIFGRDVTSDPVDTPVSEVEVGPAGPNVMGVYQNVLTVRIEGREPTLGELAHLQASTHLSPRFVGTPEMVVDQMQDRFESGCCDGFIVTHALSPRSLDDFVDLVVPELQRRGLFRKEYTGRTFRENLQG